jgi:DnaK suppressor protein
METRRAQELLAAERARLKLELPQLGPHDPEEVPDPFEQSDTGAEVLEDELADAELVRVRDELAAIERAEQRLAEGIYGLSVDSGEPIPDARLEAIPWAERTVEEQARFDGSNRR